MKDKIVELRKVSWRACSCSSASSAGISAASSDLRISTRLNVIHPCDCMSLTICCSKKSNLWHSKSFSCWLPRVHSFRECKYHSSFTEVSLLLLTISVRDEYKWSLFHFLKEWHYLEKKLWDLSGFCTETCSHLYLLVLRGCLKRKLPLMTLPELQEMHSGQNQKCRGFVKMKGPSSL